MPLLVGNLLLFAAFSISITVYDLRQRRVPNRLLGAAYALWVLFLLASLSGAQLAGAALLQPRVLPAVVTALIAAVVSFIAGFTSRGRLGFGDVKLFPLLLGNLVLVAGVPAIFGYLITLPVCTLIAVLMQRICHTKTRKQQPLAFAPVLLSAWWAAWLGVMLGVF